MRALLFIAPMVNWGHLTRLGVSDDIVRDLDRRGISTTEPISLVTALLASNRSDQVLSNLSLSFLIVVPITMVPELLAEFTGFQIANWETGRHNQVSLVTGSILDWRVYLETKPANFMELQEIYSEIMTQLKAMKLR